MATGQVKYRLYKCKRCGHRRVSETNHTGPTWSWGHYATCPKCPPHAKYPEFGGSTTWLYECEIVPQPHRSVPQILEEIDRLERHGFDMLGAWNAIAPNLF